MTAPRPIFGSPGAGRVLRAAYRTTDGWRCPGRAIWRIGDPNSDGSADLERDASCGAWRVCQAWGTEPNDSSGWIVDRSTARLLLSGLLAEGMWRELVEWVRFVADVYHNAVPDEKMDGGEALRLVLAKLRELEATK